ncbi:MAG: Cache 3/Cache 2 fusion domain-containing protein [Bacteroidetes bacterium]|nr:Cache 3/Cache 2 fusion domain-containing protein [Bacteroidota bacterium]
MKKSLVNKLLIPIGMAVVITLGILSYLFSMMLENEISENVSAQVNSITSRTVSMLEIVDDLGIKRTTSAMRIFRERSSAMGMPRAGAAVIVGKESVPNISFGSSYQANNVELVDRVNFLTGAAATVFSRRGNDFIRISTNVKKADGSRAIGTILDPKGNAIASIRRGESFCGVVDILGKPYMTAYEPMKNAAGEVIGIWYTGYQLTELQALQNSIEQSVIMDNGFSAVIDNKNVIQFRSENVSVSTVDSILRAAENTDESDWVVRKTLFGKWGYTIVTAYPVSDISTHIWDIRMMTVISGLVVTFVLLGIIRSFFNRLIVAPIRSIVEKMNNADLNTLLHDDRKDEIGGLTSAFDQFNMTIKDTLLHVNETSRSVSSSMTEISASTQQMAAGASEQSKQTADVVSSVEEMSRMIERSTKNAEVTAATAIQSKGLAEEGGDSVGRTVDGMREIASVVDRTAETVRVLGKASEQIGEIVTVIQEIADQTNLLALNAAIEAARAGDQGRGFAVVADEVRKLAERTTKATKEIAQTITKIQHDTELAVTAIDEGTGKVDRGIIVAEQAGSSLKTIVETSQRVADMVQGMRSVTNEQSLALENISNSIRSISAVTAETVNSTEQVAIAAEQMNHMTEQLNRLLERFNLGSQERKPGPADRNSTMKHGRESPAVRSEHRESVIV